MAKERWEDLLADYDVRRGRLWGLVLLWTAVGPSVTRVTRREHRDCGRAHR